MPTVSVIIPHYQDLPALERCLESLDKQTFPSAAIEIIVCDNNSTSLTALSEMIGARARVTIETTKGAGPARNRGVRESRGSILAFIDCDCVAEPTWIENGVKALHDDEIVGGRVTVFSDAAIPTGADLFEQIFAFDFKTYIEKKGFTGAGNLFCSKETFLSVGYFANGVSEDLEWSRRAVSKGFKLTYAPDVVVAHPTRPDWWSLREKWRRMVREEFLTRKLAGKSRTSWLARQVLVAASPFVHFVKVLKTTLSPAEKLRAIGTLWRIRWWRMGEGLRIALENPQNEP